MDRLLNSAKALVPVILVAVLAGLEELGVSIDIDWGTFSGYVGAGVLVWFTPNKEL